MKLRRLWLCLLFFVMPSSSAAAQFFAFGQNKIHYRRFEWRVLRGPHVDLHYYPEEANLAAIALGCGRNLAYLKSMRRRPMSRAERQARC